jgi:hypothetical protein
VRADSSTDSDMVPAPFEDEHELNSVVAENPQLLVAAGAAPPVLLIRQLTLSDAGAPGLLLLLDADSIPIIVGTRLGSSGDGRCEVVAQAIDAMSAVTQLTVAQLDNAAGGAVEGALRTFAANGQDLNRRRASLAANLRAAHVTFILAVDELKPFWDRLISYLAEHSNFDVRCVAVARCRESNGDMYYAPTMIVGNIRSSRPSPNGIRLVGSAANSRKPIAPASRAQADRRFVKRAGVWVTLRLEEAEVASVIPSHVVEPPSGDLGRVQWDG